MPWMNFLEKEPPGFCSRNEHHPLYNQRSTKTAPHSQLPLFSSPHPLCHGPRTAQDPENVRGVHKQTHTISWLWSQQNTGKFLWLLSLSDYYLSALNCILSGYRDCALGKHDHFVSPSGSTQSEVEFDHVWESHIRYPLSHQARKCVLMLPKKCQPVLTDTAQDAQGTRVEPLFTVHSFLGKQGVRTVQVTKHLPNRPN